VGWHACFTHGPVTVTAKKRKDFPLHYVVKYPDGRQAHSSLPCADYGAGGDWLIIVKRSVADCGPS
jgi:hypothetical protein